MFARKHYLYSAYSTRKVSNECEMMLEVLSRLMPNNNVPRARSPSDTLVAHKVTHRFSGIFLPLPAASQ